MRRNNNQFNRNNTANLELWRQHIEKFIQSSYASIPVDGDVLEIGIGRSTEILKGHFPKLKVLDKRTDAKGVNIIYDIENDQSIGTVGLESWDAVYLLEVLEHTTKPWKAAQVVSVLLRRPNGKLIVSVPSFLFHHPMEPICGDYWRFLPGHVPTLFPYLKCTHEDIFYPDGNPTMPLGMCYILEYKT